MRRGVIDCENIHHSGGNEAGDSLFSLTFEKLFWRQNFGFVGGSYLSSYDFGALGVVDIYGKYISQNMLYGGPVARARKMSRARHDRTFVSKKKLEGNFDGYPR